MPFDESVAERVRDVLLEEPGIVEKKMFGGLAFLDRGNMFCGVVHDELMIRVGPEGYEDALAAPHARPMDFTGRPMRGFVFVEGPGFKSVRKLEDWIRTGLEFTRTLPSK